MAEAETMVTTLQVFQSWAEILTALVAVIGIPFVIISLRHARAANFVAAWQSIADHLQSHRVRAGRMLLRELASSRKRSSEARTAAHFTAPAIRYTEPTNDEVLEIWLKVGNSADSSAKWYKEVNTTIAKLPPDEQAAQLREVMAEAVGAFDLVGILAIHSHVPGLLDVVAREWIDSILPCFREGAWVLRDRARRERLEKLECFSVLYERAKSIAERMKEKPETDLYPFFGSRLRQKTSWLTPIDRTLLLDARRAIATRQEILRHKADDPTRTDNPPNADSIKPNDEYRSSPRRE